MDDDYVPEDFLSIVEVSAKVVESRSGQRSVKEGETVLTGTVESYVGYTKDGKGNIKKEDRTEPPETEMVEGEGGSKYAKAIALYARVSDIAMVPGEVEPRKDGKPGWRIRAVVKYFEGGTEYLMKKCAEAWAKGDGEDDREMLEIRKFISPERDQISTMWVDISPGDKVKVKVPDNKGNVFRAPNPHNKSAMLVQPSTPMKFNAVTYEIFVSIKDKEVDDDGTGGNVDAAATPAADSGPAQIGIAPPTPAPAAAAAAAAGGDGKNGKKGGKKKKMKVKVLAVYPDFNCKGGVWISEDYDPNMARSERLHDMEDKDAHQMVPIREWREKKQLPPTSAYFYVKNRSTFVPAGTINPEAKGVTIVRRVDQESKLVNEKSFYYEKQGEKVPIFNMGFDLWQWRHGDADRKRHRYVVNVRTDGDIQWRQFGIPDQEAYGMIMSANPQIPIHVYAKLWEESTLKHPANDPRELENPNPKKGTENIVGYYNYGNATLTPDFLRYFKASGMRVSQDFVLQEFDNWATITKAGRKELKLTPIEPEKRNPLNSQGIHSAVIALGNGKLLNPDAKTDEEREKGRYHAFWGNAISLFEGNHDFYVLISRLLSDQEKANLTGPRAQYADDFLRAFKSPPINGYYWIYAVRRDAKMAKTFTEHVIQNQTPAHGLKGAPAVVHAVAAAQTQGTKREQTIEYPDGESVSEVSESTGEKRRRRRVLAK